MRATRFFRLVWRTNAVVILLAGLAALLLPVFFLVQFGRNLFRQREPDPVVKIDQAESPDELSLGSAERVDGTPYVLIPLKSVHHNGSDYSSGPVTTLRNYAFLKPDGAAT